MKFKFISFLIISFCFSSLLKAQEKEFSGIYIEILSRTISSGITTSVLSGQYLTSEKEVKSIIENPKKYLYNCSLKRLFNYTSFAFEELKLKIGHEENIDWNHKISLYRGNDYEDNILYLCKQDTHFAFYIKRVKIKYIELPVKHIGYDHQSILDIYCDTILLLKKIDFQQKVPASDELVKNFITPLNGYETWYFWHPSINDFVKTYIDNKILREKYNLPNW